MKPETEKTDDHGFDLLLCHLGLFDEVLFSIISSKLSSPVITLSNTSKCGSSILLLINKNSHTVFAELFLISKSSVDVFLTLPLSKFSSFTITRVHSCPLNFSSFIHFCTFSEVSDTQIMFQLFPFFCGTADFFTAASACTALGISKVSLELLPDLTQNLILTCL